MPLPIFPSHRLVERQAELRRNGRLPWLRPDAKSQVTIRYVNGKPDSIDTVVLSTQHAKGIEHKKLCGGGGRGSDQAGAAEEHGEGQDQLPRQPDRAFEIGGPKGDCGVTGRKIIVDTYGGSAPHGGGAFSGKDPSKVDRSAAYAARYVAKNIVAAGPVQVPGAGLLRHRRSASDERHGHHARHRQDVRRRALGARHEALRPAAEGHHPDARPAAPDLREDRRVRPLRAREPEFTWEATDKALALKQARS